MRRRILAAMLPPEIEGSEPWRKRRKCSTRSRSRDRSRSRSSSRSPSIGPQPPPTSGTRNDDSRRAEEGRREEEKREERERGHRENDPLAPRPTRFRFKDKSKSSSKSSRSRGGSVDDEREGRCRHQSRHRRHGSSHRSRSRSRSPSNKDKDKDTHRSRNQKHHHRHSHRHKHRTPSPQPPPEDPYADRPLTPNTAFRESLMDALADDEGAAYWEAVYGQPIHIYNRHLGPLEQMTDEEYAAYVRQKMWEKTREGLLEERERRLREKKERERMAMEERERRKKVQMEMEIALRRGEERKRKRRWEGYCQKWKEWEKEPTVEGVPWPEGVVPLEEEGEDDVAAEEREEVVKRDIVKSFFVDGIRLALGEGETDDKVIAARLKEERVRWHPDKVQQRLGGKVEERIMKRVTAIFQVVDSLWNEVRKKGEK